VGLTTNRHDPDLHVTGPNGQQKKYLVLPPEELERGFVRPVRRSYRHLKCGAVTTMGHTLAETYARKPTFYTHTFCGLCGTHPPVAEFVWDEDGQPLGS
jgi:hypothetical protein